MNPIRIAGFQYESPSTVSLETTTGNKKAAPLSGQGSEKGELKMFSPKQLYTNSRSSILVIFDIRIPGTAERLLKLHDILQEYTDIDAIDEHHFVLEIWPGAARGLLP
jgi:hypothetical protein